MTITTIESAIYAILSVEFTGATIAPRRAAKGPLPFISYRIADKQPEFDLDGYADLAIATFEFRIFARKSEELGPLENDLFALLVSVTERTQGDITIKSIQSEREPGDGDEPINDGGQDVIYMRTLRFEVLYTE
jgi:hypothetical protein